MSAAIDISPDQRRILLALFKRYIPNTTVWAFGSRVKWKARSNSDLDLVVFTNVQQAPLCPREYAGAWEPAQAVIVGTRKFPRRRSVGTRETEFPSWSLGTSAKKESKGLGYEL